MSVVRHETIAGIPIPDSALAREATELVREAAPPLLFDHSRRVFLWASLRASGMASTTTPSCSTSARCSTTSACSKATARRTALRGRRRERGPALPRSARPPGGAGPDRVGVDRAAHDAGDPAFQAARGAPRARSASSTTCWDPLTTTSRRAARAIVSAHPRTDFKAGIVRAFYEGMREKPETTFGTMNADVLEALDPGYRRPNFCRMIADAPFTE